MQLIVNSLLFLLFLASCSTGESRYRDTTNLELPPALQGGAKPEQSENRDDSALSESNGNNGRGLGSAVYLTQTEPPALRVKQAFDIAWNTLESALKQSDVEIKDRNLDKGHYYVIFDPDRYVPEEETAIDRLGSIFSNEYREAIYILTVTAEGEETQITAARASQTDQSSLSEEGDDQDEQDDKADGAERLLRFLNKTLRDDWIEK